MSSCKSSISGWVQLFLRCSKWVSTHFLLPTKCFHSRSQRRVTRFALVRFWLKVRHDYQEPLRCRRRCIRATFNQRWIELPMKSNSWFWDNWFFLILIARGNFKNASWLVNICKMETLSSLRKMVFRLILELHHTCLERWSRRLGLETLDCMTYAISMPRNY